MKWFKHLTASHTDEKLALLQAEFGLEGYGFYWLTLEVIAKQMEPGSDKTFVEYPITFWRKTYGFSPKKLRKFVAFCSEFEIFSVEFSEKSMRVDCPNLLKYRDEWSNKKRKNSGVAPESLRRKETDKDTEKEEEKKSTPDGVLVDGVADDAPAAGGKSSPSEASSQNSKPDDCPHQKIIALYHEILPELRRVRVWDSSRESFLRARWRAKAERQDLDWWRGFFEYVRGCPFLMGIVESPNGRAPFQADLEWLVRPTNFNKVIEGKYEA